MTSRFAAAAVGLALLAAPAATFATDAEQLFTKSCAPCHGKAGQPSPVFAKQGVKDFTDAAWQKATTDAQIEKVIREGKKGTMMASFEKQLAPQDVKALVAYIRKLAAAKK